VRRQEGAIVNEKRGLDTLVPSREHREYVDARIKDIEHAAGRSRWLFGFSLILSWLLLAMAYNSTWSWMRTMAATYEKKVIPSAYPSKSGERRHGLDVLVERLMGGWVDSLYFEVPILGARFSASDAGVTGGLLLVIISLWCFFSARRENHLIFYLVRDSERYNFDVALRRYLRNQLHATQVFAGSGQDKPLNSGHMYSSIVISKTKTVRLLGFAMYVCAPSALFVVFVTDIYSLSLNSPFRPGGRLYEFFWNPCFVSSKGSCGLLFELVARLAASGLFLATCAVVMHRALLFQVATQELLGFVDRRTNG
jgi:hypothetical protein